MKMCKRVLAVIGCVVVCMAVVWFVRRSDKAEYVYAEEFVKLLSADGDFTVYSGAMDCTTVNGRTYYFDDAVTDKQRNDAITLNEELIKDYLGGDSQWDSAAKIYFSPAGGDWVDLEQGAAYINVDSIGTYKHILSMLKLRYGEYSNYGYLYAMADQIAHKLKWTSDGVQELDLDVIRNNPNLLNLGYIYFDEKYATIEEVNACKALAVKILNEIDEEAVSEERFTQEIDAVAQKNDLEYAKTYLLFSDAGAYDPLIVKSKYLRYVFAKDFEADMRYFDGYLEENPTKDANAVIALIEDADEKIGELREMFSFSEEEYVPVMVTEKVQKNDINAGGLWQPWKKIIRLQCFDAIPHEYVHYMYSELTDYDSTEREGWETEALALYSTAYQMVEKRKYMANKYPETLENIKELIGKEYETVEDEVRFEYLCLAIDIGNYYNYLNNAGGIAFCDFVCNKYGTENMISCLLFPNETETYIGEDMDALLNEWKEYIESYQ